MIKHPAPHHFLALLTTLVFGLNHPSLASANLSVVVSPPAHDLYVKPGETIQKTIKVTNNGATELSLTAILSDFIVQDNEGTPVKVTKEGSGRYFASPWLNLSQSELNLIPGETSSVTVIIEVPKDALPGGHYAGVFFSPTTKSPKDSTGPQVVPEIGSLFALNIAGDISYDAAITSFTSSAPWYEFGPVSFSATIANQSDTHINTSPSLEIKDMLGRSISTLTLDPKNIFPFTSRTFTTQWDNVWGLGRYQATLTAPYGDSFAATRTLYFWIIPYRLIGAILIVLLVALASLILVKRHLLHRQDVRDQEIESLRRRLIELENRH